MTNDARIEWIIMACKGICVRHKAHRHTGICMHRYFPYTDTVNDD